MTVRAQAGCAGCNSYETTVVPEQRHEDTLEAPSTSQTMKIEIPDGSVAVTFLAKNNAPVHGPPASLTVWYLGLIVGDFSLVCLSFLCPCLVFTTAIVSFWLCVITPMGYLVQFAAKSEDR